jgi:hypothetical protein
MASKAAEVKAGDTWQGTGGMRVLFRVTRVIGADAEGVLVRSGKPKTIKVSTLRSSYELKSRGESPSLGA